jgi:hypothetical protein
MKVMKTKFKSTLQDQKKLQDKTLTNPDFVKGGTLQDDGIIVVVEDIVG